jgi:hypothetical protein
LSSWVTESHLQSSGFGSDPTEPFSFEVKDEIESLPPSADVPTVKFVAERDSVVTGTRGGKSPGRVANDGVLLSLGAVGRNGNKIQVPASLWINGLAGQWLTYVLEQKDGTWKVIGTSGPVAIS